MVFQSTGDVPTLVGMPVEVAVRQPNFTMNFHEGIHSAVILHEAILSEASGYIGIGMNMTGSYDYIELGISSFMKCTFSF